MSLEELWQIFPIILTKHNPIWKDWYAEEISILSKILFTCKDITFSHIGSTAISGIWAKPNIDIQVELPAAAVLSNVKEILMACGYLCMNESPTRISLNKGYTEKGFAEKTFHIHLRYVGDCDEIYFRDYLNNYSDVAKAYEKLKLSLCKQYEHDRDGYTAAKTNFIQKYTAIAKKEYKYLH